MAIQVELTDVIDKLTAHESVLSQELAELSAKSQQVSSQLDQIQTALAALRNSKPPTKTDRQGSGAQKKRTAGHAVIQEVTATQLRKHGSLSFEQLLGHVKSELLARSLSRVGAKSLLAEAVKNAPFCVHADQTISIR